MDKGDFVKVGNDIGTIVFLENENTVPKNHVGVWYGELDSNNNPKYRTVPIEYCKVITTITYYH